ncbi:two-component regulator propeller domain-containing protein [Filimonas effusa]|uniref:histidine kinase n=1 Tax=Filimonas effusa TaxID=2508721 RepID=A0A4Q1DC04_9BACT|nr:two-component regulator propeller domain-containing protein [Filimonas effusa]RXK86860.1 hybrid sensor histidine kinase/response regulator [Filimonas effusa]
MRYYVSGICWLCFLLSITQLWAQPPRVDHLGIEQGLSNNSVTSIMRDHNGFMWFGSFDGLNRYDGQRFKVFRNKLNDSTSLAANRIVALAEDKRNNLWIGSKRGVSITNNTSAGFQQLRFVAYGSGKPARLLTPVKDICADNSGNVFVATDGEGLLMAVPGSFDAQQLPVETNEGRLYSYSAQSIVIDSEQRVWVLLNGRGLALYNYQKQSLVVVNAALNTANCLASLGDNRLWVGASDGLYEYDISRNNYITHYNEQPGALSAARIVKLCGDARKRLWIATDGGGVNIFDPVTRGFSYLPAGKAADAIASSAVYAVYSDAQGLQWIGTLRGGVNIIDPRKEQFNTVSRGASGSPSKDFVLSFAEEPSGNLWIGSDGGGLSCWDRKRNSYSNFMHQPGNAGSLSNNFVTNICYDSYQQLWVATYGGGINRLRSNNSFDHFYCPDNWGGYNNDIWVLFEDKARNLWAGVIGSGLNRFNRTSNRFELFAAELPDILTMAEDKNGILWAGNFNSLIRIDPVKKKYDFFRVNTPVRAISIDDDGAVLWLATEGYGLLKFTPGNNQFVTYATEKGLNNPSVLTLLDDMQGHLWMGTFGGLSRFDKASGRFRNYLGADGLQSDQFNYNAALALSSGELAFGGIKGFNIFYPDSVHQAYSSFPVLLTDIKVNNQPVFANSKWVSGADADRIYSLKLPFDQAHLAFSMAALEYPSANNIKYAYFLEGWDQHWNDVEAQHSGLYSNLREGNYVLKIKATDANGGWGQPKEVLRIQVLPPWYRSWWAYTLYILAAGAIVFIYQRYRINRARLKYEVALARVNAEKERAELESAQSEKAMTMARYEQEKAERETEKVINEREKEIYEKRLSFFTNISHEFRTPLTLIISPLQGLLRKQHDAEELKDLNTINRNARRLLRLIDQLLLFRKTDKHADDLSLTRFNLSELCRDVFLYFIYESRARNISYTLEGEAFEFELCGDRNKIEVVLYNLLSNAFKYTPENGVIRFEVSETDDEVLIAITDTGKGIPAEAGDKIFDRFYQAEGHAKAGFGIGLFMVKQFMMQHHGGVSYTSVAGKGSSFELRFLKGEAHFENQDIKEYNPATNMNDMLHYEEMTEAAEAAVVDAVLPATPVISARKILLLVDDDIEMLNYMTQLFEEEFTIYKAANGIEGLEQARLYMPDLVISDIMMPGMTGIEMCRHLKDDATFNHIPVILLTAMASQDVQLQGTEQGADDYLTKPFNNDLLIAKVKGLLKNRTNLQHYFYDQVTHRKNHLKVPPEYKQLLEKCITIVEHHLDDDQFSIQVLAREIGMSHSYLYKKIKLISGQSANAFIRFLRLRKAAELLIISRATVNEVAYKVGFSDIKYFRVQFNKLFGMNPSDYIKKYRKVLGESMQVDKSDSR